MKISVIVPAYNCAAYIEKCINSLLIQKGAELEIIVVNDGSTDNISEVLEKYSKQVFLISIPNAGVANARNVGINNATGDFIMFLDADDTLKPECVEHIVRRQIETDADIVRFGYCFVFDDGSTTLPIHRFEREELIDKKDFKQKIYKNYITGIKLNSICMTLFRKRMLSGLLFRQDMQTGEDALVSMQAYSRAERVLLLPEPYYLYYQHSSGLTGKGLSVLSKYRCNFIISAEIIKHLSVWRMRSPIWYLRATLRPLVLTLDKLIRIKKRKERLCKIE